MSGGALRILYAAVLSAAFSVSAFGQAIVLDQGQTTFGLGYQHTFVRYHISSDGSKEDRGHIMAYAIQPQLSYGLTDRITLDGDAAFIAAKYITNNLPFPNGPHGPSDNGAFHATLQDFHFGVRANWLMRPLAVTPFLQVTIPSHHYQLEGHTAVGKGNPELTFGTAAGRDLGPLLPNAFIEARASHTYVRRTRVEGLETQRLNHTNASLQLGYYVTPSVTVSAYGNGLRTHGGWDFPRRFLPGEREEHDRFGKSKDIQVGADVAYTFRSGIGVYGGYFTTVWARNTHSLAGPTMGLTWTPRPRQSWLARARTRPALLLAQQ
jgi:hypothetical protein